MSIHNLATPSAERNAPPQPGRRRARLDRRGKLIRDLRHELDTRPSRDERLLLRRAGRVATLYDQYRAEVLFELL